MGNIGDFGYVRVAAAVPEVRIGDCGENAGNIIRLIREAAGKKAAVTVFPELSVTGYTCGDLFMQASLLESAERAVEAIAGCTGEYRTCAIVGVPVPYGDRLFNCAAVLADGKIAGLIPKTHLPNYGEFYEKRWFSSGKDTDTHIRYGGQDMVPFGTNNIFRYGNACFGVEICEDLWAPLPPSTFLCMAGATIVANLSASNELAGKHEYRTQLISQQSGRCMAGYVYSSAGYGESTSDLVFAGDAMVAENGRIVSSCGRFEREGHIIFADLDTGMLSATRRKCGYLSDNDSCTVQKLSSIRTIDLGTPEYPAELSREIRPHPFIPEEEGMDRRMDEIISIQAQGLASRIERINAKSAVIGISGGLDSTLALLVTVLAFDSSGRDRKDITGITMPGLGTTGRTRTNASKLMDALGITALEVPIRAAMKQHFADIGMDEGERGTAYENAQARERTQILMDIANMNGGIVVGTGDLSETALGWCTYNGDHISMYNVNGSIPKTLVIHLVKWIADRKISALSVNMDPGHARKIIYDIIDTPISPELLPSGSNGEITQKTEDLIGPYELRDFFLYHFIRLGETPRKILYTAEIAFSGKYDKDYIRKWLGVFIKRFFSQQFKRNCMPDSPKAGTVALSPRGDWRMPSEAMPDEWIDDLGQ